MCRRSLILVTAAALTAVFAASLAAWPLPSAADKPRPAPKTNAANRTAALKEPKTFASYEALTGYIEQYSKLANLANLYFYDGSESLRAQEALPGERAVAAPKAAVVGQVAGDYSLTNVQVEGVDEADIVKTDGKYLYAMSGSKIAIISAYPPDDAELLSEIVFPGSPIELFISGDRMVVFGTADGSGEFTAVIYDVADREKPVLEKTITSPSRYVTSRFIGDYAYVILDADVYDPHGSKNDKPVLP
ncbi:MAG: beta-propeller domain-containing protein, partial [Firmicutes bacterium]|nr:beta-propeller domain-containing protein [Bacillota bacterium]